MYHLGDREYEWPTQRGLQRCCILVNIWELHSIIIAINLMLIEPATPNVIIRDPQVSYFIPFDHRPPECEKLGQEEDICGVHHKCD